MPFGAAVLPDRGVRFRFWAPAAHSVRLVLDTGSELAMERTEPGWHTLTTDCAAPGSTYRFRLPDGTLAPDPASRFQPQDVHGPSEVIDPASYAWRDGEWRNRPWTDVVLYELHVGAFTREGTFRAAIDKLDHLVDLGITCIDLMPVADFPGRRNWGYDGVFLFAPESSYGRPDDLKAFVDEAHRRGLMVVFDVVYNHFGPDGNLLPTYAPQSFTNRHETPWGDAVNFDSAGSAFVREFVVQNALYWLEEFHCDGLRLDAVHAIHDDSETHILTALAERVRTGTPRPVHLIIENERNQATRLSRDPRGEPLEYTAQWNDDIHHVLHTAATGERHGYYIDFANDPRKLGRALAEGFAFQGETMTFTGASRGEPSKSLPPTAFVSFIQNHDQIGNRPFGDRIHFGVSTAVVRAIASIYLLAPQIPMLFMGEEWACSSPFPFFCDFAGELGQAVNTSRQDEFVDSPEVDGREASIPDPQEESTFDSAKLDWDEMRRGPHADTLRWYGRILAARKRDVLPFLAQSRSACYQVRADGPVTVRYAGDRGDLVLVANLSDRPAQDVGREGRTIWYENPHPDPDTLGPWAVRWSFAATRDATRDEVAL